MRDKTRRNRRDRRLRQIDRDLLAVKHRIRVLSEGYGGTAGSSAAGWTDYSGESNWNGTPGTGDRRFASYLASSFEARQPLNAEPGTSRNKFIFIAAVAVLAFVVWVLALIL